MSNNYQDYLSSFKKKSEGVLIFSNKYPIINNTYLKIIEGNGIGVCFGEVKLLKRIINDNGIKDYELKYFSLNQGAELLSYSGINARIEPGAVIREKVNIKEGAVILMGAIVNIGAEIGEYAMIDMGAVIGSGAKIGTRSHVGANSVIAGMLEPFSDKPVVIEDDCFIGANSVVLEGITIGHDSIVGALTLVNKDIPPYSRVIGSPCVITSLKETTKDKCKINEKLR